MSAVPGTPNRELRSSDMEAVREQLGRDPTTPFTVVARCSGGHPLVIRNAPRDAAGAPFPTTYWLTCPEAVKAVARLEAAGAIARFNEQERSDPAFAQALLAAHRAYAEDRATDLPEALEDGGVGGTRRGVKCLHAHYAFHLAGGVDPVGAMGRGADGADPRRGAAGSGRRDRPGDELDPAARGGAAGRGRRRSHRARARHGHHAAGPGRRPDGPAGPRGAASHGRRARTVLPAGTRVACGPHPRGGHERRPRRGEPRRVRCGGPRARRQRARGDQRRARGRTVVPGRDPRPGSVDGSAAVPGARHRRRFDRVRRRTRAGPSRPRRLDADGERPPDGAVRRARPAGARRAPGHDARDRRHARTTSRRAVPIRDARTLVAVAGTATTLQAIALGLDRYDPDAIHRTWLLARNRRARPRRTSSA